MGRPDAGNSSAAASEALDDGRDEALAAVEIAVQAVILTAAVLGNAFVLVALCAQRRRRSLSRVYLFMMHLSIADLLVAAFSIFPQLLWDVTFRFRGGDLTCRLVKYLQVMVLYLSTYIIVMMAVDRFRAVCWTVRLQWHSLGAARLMVGCAWGIALVAAAPQAIIFRKTEISPGVEDCWAQFADPWGDKVYVTWFVLSIFVIPLTVIGVCYGVICYRIWTYDPGKQLTKERDAAIPLRPLPRPGDAPHAPLPTPEPVAFRRSGGRIPLSQAKLKTVKLTLVVVICFFVCWSPFCITQLVLTYNPPSSAIDVGPLEVICLLLASLNSCTNPWVYLMFSDSLLNQLRLCLGLSTGRPRHRASIGEDEPDPPRPQAAQNGGPAATPTPPQPSDSPSRKLPSTRSEMV